MIDEEKTFEEENASHQYKTGNEPSEKDELTKILESGSWWTNNDDFDKVFKLYPTLFDECVNRLNQMDDRDLTAANVMNTIGKSEPTTFKPVLQDPVLKYINKK